MLMAKATAKAKAKAMAMAMAMAIATSSRNDSLIPLFPAYGAVSDTYLLGVR